MRRFSFLLCCLAGIRVAAQQSSSPAPEPVRQETTVTGTYAPVPLDEADRSVRSIPVSFTVFRNADDALASVPSVDIRQRSPGIQGDLSIRGSSFGQTLVLVDGLRLNDAQTAHNNLDLPFPFAALNQIEVLEGTGSTIYGADAVGGAVNFLTAPATGTELRLADYGGSFGTNGQDGSLSYRQGPWAEQFTFVRELSTGFMPDRDYRSLAFGSESSLRSSFGLTRVLLGSSDRPFGAGGFYGSYPSWERMRGWFAGVTQSVGEQTDFSFGFRRHTDLYDLFRYSPRIYENRHETESWQAAIRRHQQVRSNVRIYYGGEGYRDSIISNNLGRHTRDRGAAYASLDVRALKRFSLNLGVREEFFTGGRHEFSPSASGGYWVNEHFRLHAAASSAFRLPTFTDLYYSDPANQGNPNLRPEQAWSFEGGAQLTMNRVHADIVVFRRYDHNNIDYVRPNSGTIWQAENVESLIFTGATATAGIQVATGQRLDIGYSALLGEEGALAGLQSKYLFQYPVHQATVTWWGHAPQQITTHLRIGVVNRYRLDPYPLLEFSAERQFAHVKPFVQLSNLSNTSHEEIPGVRLPGRSYIGGVELTFRQIPR